MAGSRLPTEEPRWLLLIHQIPPNPPYFRAKVGRRLQRLGAVAIKNAVYVLPATTLEPSRSQRTGSSEEPHHDFRWLAKEIVQEGGEATVCRASLVDGVTNEQVEALFQRAREADYRALAEEARAASKRPAARSKADRERWRLALEAELGRLRKRLAEVREIDFFDAPGLQAAEAALSGIEQLLQAQPKETAAPAAAPTLSVEDFKKRTWVTRANVHVDRIACAWLIRRFIDPDAKFRFIASPENGAPAAGSRREVTFDVTEGDFTHVGDACSFETFVLRFGLRDPALETLAEIVHDLDVKDGKFGRVEAPGVAALVAGLALVHSDDDARIAQGRAAFDALYAQFRRRRA